MKTSLRDQLFTKIKDLLHTFPDDEKKEELLHLFKTIFQSEEDEGFLEEVIQALFIAFFEEHIKIIKGTIHSITENYLFVEDQHKKLFKFEVPETSIFEPLINNEIKIIAEIKESIYLPHQIHIKKTREPKQSGNPVA